MGKSYKQLKKIIEEKNNTVDYLKREGVKKTLRISELENELENLKKSKLTIPFIEETKHALFEAEKEIVEPSATFSSRFMPNVRFLKPSNKSESICFEDVFNSNDRIGPYNKRMLYFATSNDGSVIFNMSGAWFKTSHMPTVNYLEAVPELVPDGMVYDKGSDSLIPCVIHDDISTFLNDDLLKRLGKFVSCCNEAACYSTKKKDELAKQTKATSICDSCSEKDMCLLFLFKEIAGKTAEKCAYFKEDQDD